MTDTASPIFVALEASALGAAIRRSSWAYMVANVGHIVSLVVFSGAVAMLDRQPVPPTVIWSMRKVG